MRRSSEGGEERHSQAFSERERGEKKEEKMREREERGKKVKAEAFSVILNRRSIRMLSQDLVGACQHLPHL